MARNKKLCNGNSIQNDQTATASRDDQSVKQFKPGDITWIKTRNSWWPGQVVNEESVVTKPKKRVKDGVLVRMYGCYEYIYVNPVKSSAEFSKILKKENLSVREAFQKAMDKELSHVKPVGKAEREGSETRGTASKDSPEDKKQKQADTEKMKDLFFQPGASSGDSGEPGALEKEKPKSKAVGGERSRQDQKTSLNVYKRTRSGASRSGIAELGLAKEHTIEENMRQGPEGLKETPPTVSKVYKRTRSGTSRGGTAEQGLANEQALEENVRHEPDEVEESTTVSRVYKRTRSGTSRGGAAEQGLANEQAQMENVRRGPDDVEETTTVSKVYKRTRSGASKDQIAETEVAQNQMTDVVSIGASEVKETQAVGRRVTRQMVVKAAEASKGDLKVKAKTEGTSRQPKAKGGSEHKKETAGNNASKEKTRNQGAAGKAKVGVPKGKNSIDQDVEVSDQTKGSCITKSCAPEDTAVTLSERKLKVMQNLGLVAPNGSPYRKCGFVASRRVH